MSTKLTAANAALQQGRKAEAADRLIEALTERPDLTAPTYVTLLNVLLELGRNADGLYWSQRALERAPKDYAVLNLHGAFLRLAGRHEEAHQIFDRAIKLRPGELAARANKGHLYNDAKNGPAAETIFSALVRQHPRIAELQRSLGVALANQGKLDIAERRFRQALSLNPANIGTVLDLSATQHRLGDTSSALSTLDEGMGRSPDNPRLARAKAVMLWHSRQSNRALTFLRSLQPRFDGTGWFHYELARNLMQSSPDESTQHYHRSIELEPDNREYRISLAEHLLRRSNRAPGENIDDAYAILATCPPPIPPVGAFESRIRAQILGRAVDLEGLRQLGSFSELGTAWAEAGLHTALLDHLARVVVPEDRRELVRQHRIWGDKVIARAKRQPIRRPSADRSPGKIRLGFMSSDLREHPVTYFTLPLFELADRDRFEIYCYSYFSGREASPLQRELTELVDVFRWHRDISDHDAAQMIADDDLDMLIELGGTTYMNKLEVMAWKPARICASWLGYPHSAGLDTIDYLLLDPYLTPPDPELLIERSLQMPDSWITISGRAFAERYTIHSIAAVRRNGYITFGSANNPYKFTPLMLETWAEIMNAVPSSRFIFLRPEIGSKVAQSNLLAAFGAKGVSADRIEFRAIGGTYMPHYNDIDIALDTFPQTGGTTTCEALWMGVPTVSLVGETVFERLSYSVLSNAGLADLCAHSVEDYISIALRLAGDPDRIQELRTSLRDQIRASPLGQTEQFARDFYDLIASTVESYSSGIKPFSGDL